MFSLVEMLIMHEGVRLQVYDDATGKPIKAGSVVVGNPTLGVGRNVANPGISTIEAMAMLATDIAGRQAALNGLFPWYQGLSEIRQGALVDMSFMGLEKLKKFRMMLLYLSRGQFAHAADEILTSKWSRDVGQRRAQRVAFMIRNDRTA